ncbi:hypothetical protein [Donghicola mangrovi]|uniref:Uncharacterized protein n=1 Tax=Donghicola mangrovi TaxID=2729614 RepID=A0A850QA47_9RHOB|nr:hypothetical protein [Donghicola mangrovi]NVO23169.1 hypothetical protein [Donghicola mangrovi]
MQIALHIGAHGTDNDRLIQCLTANADRLEIAGISVPQVNDYRKPILDMLTDVMKGDPVNQRVRDRMLKDIGVSSGIDRIVLAQENILGRAHRIFERGKLYPIAPKRLADVNGLLPTTELQIYMGIRNPVMFIAETFRLSGASSFAEFVDGVRLADVRWSDMIEKLVNAVPQADFTVWCHEDLPILWGDILREVAGVESDSPMAGEYDILAEVMTAEGLGRLKTYIDSKPPQTAAQRQRIIMAFLDKFAIEEKLEQELDLPGLTQDIVERVTVDYERDLKRVAELPGVRLLQP